MQEVGLMAISSGKRFENDFKKACKKHDPFSVTRLYDNVGGYAGIKNICDYVFYAYPNIYYLELKSTKGNTLNWANITEHQWKGLMEEAGKKGVISGILVQYSDHDEHYFADIRICEKLKQQGKKSLHIKDAKKYGALLPARKRIKTYELFLYSFVSNMVDTQNFNT